MAIFGRSFPLPRRFHSSVVAPASTVGARFFHPVRLPDRPRPKLGAFISKPPPAAIIAGSMNADTGFYVLTGEAALFTTTMPAAFGTYTLTGIDATFTNSRFASAPLVVHLPVKPRPHYGVFISAKPPVPLVPGSVNADTGFFVVTGESATFTTTLAAAQGSYTLTGEDATFTTAMPGNFGTYAELGIDATFTVTQFAEPLRPFKLPDRRQPHVSAFVSKPPPVTLGSVMAEAGLFALTGFDAGLSSTGTPTSDNVGSRIVAHTFTRKRYHELMAELRAEQEAALKAAEKAKPERAKIIQKAVRASGILGNALETGEITANVIAETQLHLANLASVAAAKSRAETAAKTALLIAHVDALMAKLEEEELEMLLFMN